MSEHRVQLQSLQVKTSGSALRLLADHETLRSQQRVVILIHGALRNASVLFNWYPILRPEFAVGFVELPGHGSSPPAADPSVENFSQWIGELVNEAFQGRNVFVIGESLGGLVALRLGGLGSKEIKGVVAADPPLTMRKVWHVESAVKQLLGNAPGNAFLRDFALNIFGVKQNGLHEERIFYDLVRDVAIPALILTGDAPLFPPRNSAVVPCVMDEVDRYVISHCASPLVSLKTVIDCGHLVLTDGMQGCVQPVREFLLNCA